MSALSPLLLLAESLLGLATCYLLGLLLAAATTPRSRPRPAFGRERLRFVVLVPAHNEEGGIEETLLSLDLLDYPQDKHEVIVIADNCTDRTAEIARTLGATVYERENETLRGKGHALAWALERLRSERPETEAIAVVDADCRPSPNLLVAMEARLGAGAVAVQTDYVVANPGESWSSALRYAAFSLINTIHPMAKSRLGLSCGLLGTGMGFTRELLERYPWNAYSIVEDGEYHSRLVAGGERVVFAAEASVSSAMPTSLREARQQQMRWEGGRWELIRRWTSLLVREGIRQRDPVRLHAAWERLVPPQSLLLATNVLLLVVAPLSGSTLVLALAAANTAGQICYVLSGLLLVGAPAQVYRALAFAPVLVVWKLGLYIKVLAGRGPTSWIRTTRDPIAATGRGESA